MLAACTDDTGLGPGRKNGYLYFNVSESQGWADGNKATRAGAEAPMLMQNSISGGAPIYLHTEVKPTMSPQLEKALENGELAENTDEATETRGIRYTEDVFAVSSGGSPKISNIGVYATRTADRGNLLNFVQIVPTSTEAASGTTYDSYAWNVAEQEISDVWDSGTADFYSYAPYFNPTSNSNGLSVAADASTGVPTITYNVPSDVTQQLDILTAKKLNVPKNTDVELEFSHVMAAIKFQFKYGHTPDGSATGAEKDNFRWSDGVTTYDVKVTNIQINGVYKSGTWLVGDDPYLGARWTVDTSAGTGNFSYAPAKNLTGETSPVDLNPDASGNVFMMLPQQVPADATIQLTCELTPDGESTATKTMSLNAALKETDGTTPKTWLPGYTYTYTLSLSDFTYVFDYNTATAKNYTNVVFAGTSEENVFIRSYKLDSKGNKSNVNWEVQYKEYESTAVGDGADNVEVWKTGSNGWINVYDRSTGTYNTKVLHTHAGANENDTDNERLFKIEVASIMVPTYDLSMWNYDQTQRWKGRSTSNCYIVAGPGKYRIPLIYGNAWTNGTKNERAYDSGITASDNILGKFLNYEGNTINTPFIKDNVGRSTVANACLIWEEGDGTGTSTMGGNGSNQGTVIKVNPVIDTAVTGEDTYNTDNASAGTQANCDYLQFEIDPENFSYGNAVVGIRDGAGNIIWSWHIWIVDAASFIGNNPTLNLEDHEVTYASTNIGWVDGGRSIPAQTREGHARLVQEESGKIITIDATQNKRRAFTTYFTNVFYQWGRKDPVRGITDPSQEGTNNGAPRGAAGVQAYTNEYGNKTSIANAIKNPNKVYGLSYGDLYTNVYYNLWASTLDKYYDTNGGTWRFYGKTIYDPSPVGYCVPPSKYLTKLSRSGFAEIGSSATLPIICNYTDGSTTLMFHASGCRTTSTSKGLKASGYHTPALLNAANGFYHTATPYSHDESWQLHLYFYSGIDTHNFIRGDMCEALSVKPVVWKGEIVEEVEVDEHQEYLTFKFFDSGSLYWQDSHAAATSRTISYSLDKGQTWNIVTSSFSGSGTKIADVAENTVVWVKGTNDSYCRVVGGVYYYQHFHSTANYELSGNIMSLIYGDNFQGQTRFPENSSFNLCSIFYDPTASSNKNAQLEEVDGLVLPATILTESCYESMFQNCTKLTSAPELPATAGVTNCYKNMYNGCSNLNTVKVMLSSPSTSYTSNWLSGVASGGTFFYNGVASWTTNSASGIPSGWNGVPLD